MMKTTEQPRLFKGTEDAMKDYVKKVKEIDKERNQLLRKKNEEIDAEYDDLKKNGSILCNDEVDKATKVDRIVTVSKFPENGFVYRPVKLTKNILDVMESDWKYSHDNDREVFRMLCIDPSTNNVSITNDKTRVEGSGMSVVPKWDLCDESFPGKKMLPLGGVHTHPDFYDKPLESLGDVMVFSTASNELFACTTTGWGTLCMFRKKEPVKLFDVPRAKKGSDGKPEPVFDKNGKMIYDVKSDVVDWNRTLRFANRGLTESVFVASRGIINEKLTNLLSHVAWFPPEKENPSTGTAEAAFDFGNEKAEPQDVDHMECESFVDIYGSSAKVRTVCNNDNGKGKDANFYVETNLNPTKLFFFPNKGFPTNFWHSDDVEVEAVNNLEKTDSRFWDYVDENRKGYVKTRSERTETLIGGKVERKTVRAAKFKVKGKSWCEYLLLPVAEAENPVDVGKPAAIMCRKKPAMATDETCILT